MTLSLFAPTSGAVLDETRAYRYRLWRTWRTDGPRACFVMVNPSTADASKDDPTIRKCIALARRWECAGLDVVNLFAWRATDPKELYVYGRPTVGPENDRAILDATERASLVVCAWGVHGQIADRDRQVAAMLVDAGRSLYCLGTTKGGHPKHPLFLPVATAVERFTVRRAP